MLYVTTRPDQDAYTAFKALTESRAPGEGLFLPMQLPTKNSLEIQALKGKTFAQNVAEIVNQFFSCDLDGWGIEFAIGRYPIKLTRVSGRATIAETWHNPAWRFERLARGIEKAIRQSDQISQSPSDWLMIASRIAVFFGIFGELLQDGTTAPDAPIDVAVPSGNLSACVAACYARKMGLPIANVIVCCNENAAAWNLLHKGELRTDAVLQPTTTPDCDHQVPVDLERLIYDAFGEGEVQKFLEVLDCKGNYYLEPWQLEQLRQGICVAVVSQSRVSSTISTLYGTSSYLADPYTALTYAGLIDYRARSGEGRHCLILSEESPVFSQNLIADSLGITSAELRNMMDKA